MGHKYDLIIIGSGPAGLSAAIYAQRAKLDTLVMEKNYASGGQVLNTYEVDNYPGLKGINGFDMGTKFREHADELGAVFAEAEVRKLVDGGAVKRVITDQETYEAKSVIIATGARHRKLGVPGEEELSGMGVSYCATCDGAFFKGKDVVLVGGGNTALEDALYLAKICGSVTLVHRRESFRGERRLAKAVQGHPNIRILYNATVTEIRGDETVNAVLIKDGKTGTVTPVGASAIFIAIGYEPENRMFSPPVRLDKAGYILAGEDCRTGVQGVFAAGDCRTKPLRQIVTATADGAVAAFQAGAYLSAEEEKKG